MWTDAPGQQKKNDAVAADPTAIHRGGALMLDTVTLQQELLPWADDDGDSITLDFILPGAIENIAATPVGWEGTVANSDLGNGPWGAGVADLDGVKSLGKLADAMDTFTAPGAQSYVRIPILDVPASGEWRPVQKQLGGDWEDFGFHLQPEMLGPDIEQPAWGVDSIAVIHKTKQHDRTNGPKYMTGKAAHLPAPVAVGFRSNGTTITGWRYGSWEIDEVTGILTKVFDAAAIQSWSAQTAHVVVDATVGNTGLGAIKKGYFSNQVRFLVGATADNNAFVMPEDGVFDSVTFLNLVNMTSTYDMRVGLYTQDTPGDNTALTLVANSNLTRANADSAAAGSGNFWNTRDYLTKPSLSANAEFVFGFVWSSNSPDTYFDSLVNGGSTYDGQASYTNDDMPATQATALQSASNVHSVYGTYTAAGTEPPVTTNTTVVPTSQAQGGDVALSADGTDADHTINAAEYYIDSDPGEGSGTAMSLGAGTTTREATATIDTTGLTVAAHTVYVRMSDATDGWGSPDSTALEVTEPVVADADNSTLNLGIGIGL